MQTMYSAHSWLGVLTIALFGIQAIYSAVIYYIMKWPAGSEREKAHYVDIHHFIGHVMFAVGLASCATGFQSMQSSDLASMPDMTDSVDSRLASAGSILLLALGIATFAALKFLPVKKNNLDQLFASREKAHLEESSGLVDSQARNENDQL